MPLSYPQPLASTDIDDDTADARHANRRPPPQFYLSSTGVSPALGPQRACSRSSRSITNMSIFSSSLPSTPGHSRRPSRGSMGALHDALRTYKIPSPDHYYVDHTRPSVDGAVASSEMHGLHGGSRMDALVEIHRILYRGREDEGEDDLPWTVQGHEVKRVVERWFEADCSYDHPLVRLSSRQSVLTHFALLHLLSTAYAPSITPGNVVHLVRALTSKIKSHLLDEEDVGDNRVGDVEAGITIGSTKQRVDTSDAKRRVGSSASGPDADNTGRWFKIWVVTADCREIGNMECYVHPAGATRSFLMGHTLRTDGHQLAMIEHVVSLTLFPSLVRRPVDSLLLRSASDDSIPSLDMSPPKSFSRRLVSAIADEFDYLLRWDLPVSTTVHFNEVGRATHVRDSVDFLDLVETFVPFAKRISWLTRRVTGLVTSSVGTLAMAMVPGPTVQVAEPIRAGSSAEKNDEAIGLGFEMPAASLEKRSLSLAGNGASGQVNTLGLDGMAM